MTVDFTVFGGVGVRVDGVELPVRGRRERAVLATLLAAHGDVASADRLVEDVWDGAAPASASTSLQVAVSRLRAMLEPDRGAREPSTLLVTTGPGYALRPERGAVDADRYADLAERAITALASGDAAEALALCEEAAAVWRGMPYADAPESALLRAERARLEELRLTVLEVRAEALLARGRHAVVAAELQPLLDAYPFRERLWELSALAHYRSGRQADALATLRRARATLADELGIDPSPELRRREAQILAQDPELDARSSHPDPLPRRGPADDSDAGRALVGRDPEFGRLRALLHEAAAGSARFALLEGEPGIGKTRLLEELAATAAAAGATAVWGRCADGQVAPAYWPWLEVVRGLVAAGLGGRIPPDASALIDPAGLPPGGLSQDRRFRLFESVVGALEGAAAAAPLVVLIEDLHWADPASAELLTHLTLRLHDVPALLVASLRELELGRTDAVTDAVAAMVRRPETRRIPLGGVPPAAASALVAAAVDRPVPADVAAAIHRRGEGNPFCIGELSRLLAANGSLDEVRAVELAGVPAGVRDVVRGRLAALSERTRSVLEVAAVIGREADLSILLAASGRPADECLDALEEALVHRVLVPVPGVPGRHRFAHALVAEAALAEVPSIRVARLHARVAEAVRAAGGGWEAVAGHLWSAGPVVPPGPTADALERAAETAKHRTAYESADVLLQRALTLRHSAAAAGAPGAEAAELRTLLALATLRRELGGYGAAYAAIDADRAHDLAARVGRLDLRMALLHLQWGALATSGRVAEATRIASVLRDLGTEAEDPILRMIGHHAWGVQCWHLGRLQEGARHMEHVDRMMRSIDPDDLEHVETFDSGALFAAFAVHVLDLAGRLEDADDRFAEVAARFPESYELMVVTNFVGFSAVCAGEPERVRAWLRRAPLRLDTRFGMFGATVQIFTGWASALLEDPEEGLATLQQGMTRFLQMGARTALSGMVCAQVQAMLAAGRSPQEAAAVLQRGAAEARASGEPLALPYLELAAACIAAATTPAGPDVAPSLRHALDGGERSGNVRLVSLVARLAEEWGIALPAEEEAGADPSFSPSR